jgi:hypothetical protein
MPTKANEKPDHAITVETSDAGDDPLKPLRERFQVHQTFWSQIHAEAQDDDNFVAGNQWPAKIKADREEAGRPVLTYNLFPSFCRQIRNKVRQERPQIKIRPVEQDRHLPATVKNVQGTKDYSLADVFSGIIRNIEHVSRADQAYDTSITHAVDHGFGFFYVENTWSKHDPFVQELLIRRVKDSYSVYLDPSSQEADYSDAQDGFLFTSVNRATFAEKYPDAKAASFDAGGSFDGWWDAESVRVAQYYRVEYRDDEVLLLSNGKVVYFSDVKDVLDELELEQGIHVLVSGGKPMRRKVKRPICTWRKITGCDVLEGPLDLPFEHVPIFAVLGDEQLVDGQMHYISAIRDAKDAARSYNYWRTAAAETVALAPRAPYMGTEKQFAGHEHLYETANSENHPYLTYNHIEGVPPPMRQFPSGVSAGELALATQDARDMQTMIGLHDASLGRESNEKSGRAIERRQAQGLTSTFQFPDNLGRAQEHMARVLIHAIPRIYDTRRVMRIRLPDDTEDFVEINTVVTDRQSGKTVLVHDLGVGRYDVVMEPGIDYATQMQEARDTQLEILKVLGPEKASQIVHLVVENVGGPGADKIARVLRKLLPDELKSDEEKRADLPAGIVMGPKGQFTVEETGEPWQPPLTPAQQLMQQQQQVDKLKAEAEIAAAQSKQKDADARVAIANAKLEEAKLKLGEMQRGPEGEQARDDVQFLKDVEELVRRVMEEHEKNPKAHGDATTAAVTESAVEVLERVKRYVDSNVAPIGKKVESAEQERKLEKATARAAGSAEPKTPAADSKEPDAPNVVRFTYDDAGELVGAQVDGGKLIKIERGRARARKAQ